MKNLYLISLALLFSATVSAQNTFPPGGNVGIGTSSPTSGLEIHTEGSNVNDGALFLVGGVNAGFGGGATLAGIKTIAGDGGQYNLFKVQNAGGVKFLINGSGSLGIGTGFPQTKLHVNVTNNGLNIIGGFQNANGTQTGGNAVGFGFVNEAEGTWWKAAIVHERTGDYGIGSLKFLVNNSTDNSSVSLTDAKMTILSSGYVGIGTTTPRESLSVNGNIRAKQIKVESANWPDYVLKPTYQLPSLAEVKSYIDQNQHLPEIPSVDEIAKNGLNVGEMNKLLMKKVEELTLYAIENEQKDKEKDKLLTALQEQINLLKEQLTAIQKGNKN
ncbi:hypothetical protein FHW88_000447 [Mucilaginibacter sp. SG538B]|uniref:hypothetical protein n=1 Tax=Mucilaginibacter sp. SG538B TaxID=2587021 RepID=UPI00159D6A0A|nr:hypothetical protein [Mucilaginibacter sp. SG538B]NVM62171.1 hypothetical protein [Mucilaginibacter sp. SG538B]